MKMSFKLLTVAALAVGTAAMAAPAAAASIPSDRGHGYDYAPSYVSYVPGPGYFAWQSGYSAPAAITSRDVSVTHHRDWR